MICGADVDVAGVSDLRRLMRSHGKGRWRKMKGFALVHFPDTGETSREEVHWYEAHGIGKRKLPALAFTVLSVVAQDVFRTVHCVGLGKASGVMLYNPLSWLLMME